MVNLTKFLCRACLKAPKKEDSWNSLFSKSDEISNNEKFNICTGIKIDPQCNLAVLICDSCESNLFESFKFLILCRQNNEIFQEYLKDSIKEQNNESIVNKNISLDNKNVLLDHINCDIFSIYAEKNNFANKSFQDRNITSIEKQPSINCKNLKSIKSYENCKNAIEDKNILLKENKLLYEANNFPDQNLKTKSRKKIITEKLKYIHNETKEENIINDIINDKLNVNETISNNKYVCDICGNCYKGIRQLEFHRHLHTGIKNVKCEICGRGFAHKSYLAGHMLSHNRERKYSCRFCEKKFCRPSTKKLHERTHTMEFSYECTICGKKFVLKTYLTRHMRIHNDERPYDCKMCGVSFRRDHHLVQHFKAKAHQELAKLNNIFSSSKN